jgi:CXXC-20-CXXC protein
MGPSCPQCKKSDFSYRELLSVHPYPGEFSPARITCPSCGAALRVTANSRLVAVTLILIFGIAPVFLLAWAGLDLSKWQIILFVLALLAIYNLAIWPHVVRLKPWTEWQYWLPKSRLVGYTVYLLLPIATIAFLIFLAARFGLGM